MIYARQSTAIIVTVGPVLDANGVAVTDGVVGDFKITKNGGAPAALNASATLTHRHTGHYSLSLTTSDVDTVGTAEVVIDDTVNACPMKEIQVLEEVVYDALFAASAPGYGTAQTGDSFARLGAPAGASVSADIAAIEAQTDDIGAAGVGLTAIPWNSAWDAEVQSEVDDAIVAQRLDELLNADSDIDGAAPPTVGSVFHELLTKTTGSFTYDQTTDSLEAIRDKETDIETDTQDIQNRLPAALGAQGNIKADVRDYNGSAGTFSGGRPEVNTSHWGGTAVATAIVRANTLQIEGTDATDYFSGHVATITSQFNGLFVINSATVGGTGNDGSHVHIPTATSGDDEFNEHLLVIFDVSDDEYHARWIQDWVISTHLATLETTLPFVPASGDTVWILANRRDVKLPSNGLANITAWSVNVTGNLSGSVGSVAAGGITAASIATGAIDADALAADVVTDIWMGTALTETYRSANATGTPAQLLYEILQNITEFAISGTTKTVKKLDGSTAKTYTLDSSSAPTSITETS